MRSGIRTTLIGTLASMMVVLSCVKTNPTNPVVAPPVYTITYSVTASSSTSTKIWYNDVNGASITNQTAGNTPFSTSFTTADTSFLCGLSCQNSVSAGSVTIDILINNVVEAHRTANMGMTGAPAFATTNGTIAFFIQ
ncbi:MAG: MmpS family transport accessory protein [Spirochaetota bacterium]